MSISGILLGIIAIVLAIFVLPILLAVIIGCFAVPMILIAGTIFIVVFGPIIALIVIITRLLKKK